MVKIKLLNSAKMLIAIAAVGFSISAYAQTVEEVTLTVSGDGATKQEATETALRSAVGQAFGVFVSANTTILNDELVKDEIATVASGNIKAYKEITSVQLPNGNISVTLKATVSVSKLISYAQSKGSTTEFAGANFGMNIKLKELNRVNEEKAIANMLKQLGALTPTMFDYRLRLEEPRIGKKGNVDIVDIKAHVDVLYNDNTEIWNGILLKTLEALSMTKEEFEEYKKIGIERQTLELQRTDHGYYNYNNYYHLRSKYVDTICKHIEYFLTFAAFNFKITDNLGEISMVNLKQRLDNVGGYFPWIVSYTGLVSSMRGAYKGENNFHPTIVGRYGHTYYKNISHLDYPHLFKDRDKKPVCYTIDLTLEIPKDDISKYSNFTISNKEE